MSLSKPNYFCLIFVSNEFSVSRHVNHPPTVQEQDDLGQENANQSEVEMNNKNRKSSVGKKDLPDIINQPEEKGK